MAEAITISVDEYKDLLRKEMALASLERYINTERYNIDKEFIAGICGLNIASEQG